MRVNILTSLVALAGFACTRQNNPRCWLSGIKFSKGTDAPPSCEYAISPTRRRSFWNQHPPILLPSSSSFLSIYIARSDPTPVGSTDPGGGFPAGSQCSQTNRFSLSLSPMPFSFLSLSSLYPFLMAIYHAFLFDGV